MIPSGSRCPYSRSLAADRGARRQHSLQDLVNFLLGVEGQSFADRHGLAIEQAPKAEAALEIVPFTSATPRYAMRSSLASLAPTVRTDTRASEYLAAA